ncbi:MAG: T9SS type A sorting domain-containing protein [Bacteroidetes bacterium]|nr:T9SS type A sorting domain-containing protein [Bacteroidota bacterium]
MKKLNIYLQVMLMIFVINLGGLLAQTLPIPSTTGTNSVSYNPVLNVYEFNCNGTTIYRYEKSNGGYSYNSGATFHAIQTLGTDGYWFYPSYVGGITAWLAGAERKPWDVGVTYTRLTPDPTIVGNTVTSYWRMQYGTDFIDYRYDMTISGKTLIINVDASSTTKATGIHFDRCENANNPRNVRIPYLTLFNILYCNQGYTSLFVNWETTNCSTIYPFDPSEYTVPPDVSTKSIRFSQVVKYNQNTNGNRNTLKETIYLTVSSNINEVLPNLVGPTAPYKTQAASKTVLCYWPPYTWLNKPPVCSNYTISSLASSYQPYAIGDAKYNRNYKLLSLLKRMGVNGLNVIIKAYQNKGFDSGYPQFLPANTFVNGTDSCSYNNACTNTTSNQPLMDTRDTIVNKLGYGFALHENYVDTYANWSDYSNHTGDLVKTSSGQYYLSWPRGGCSGTDTSRVFNVGKASYYLTNYGSGQIVSQMSGHLPTWCYLDVHSAANPSDFVDYDASANKDSSSYFKFVLHKYRKLPDYLRSNYSGPVQGEGHHHFLYVGYFDDLEARLHTADYYLYGYKAPLFVDFDLTKMHSKSAFHGVGHCGDFFAPTYKQGNINVALSDSMVWIYMASELAYGHSGLITKSNVVDHTIYQALLEYKHIYPIQLLIANATPSSIEYYHAGSGPYTASQYISLYSSWDNYMSSDFMSQVKITYDNGIIIWVNRSPFYNWSFTLSQTSGWFSWNASVSGFQNLYAGSLTQSFSVTLPTNYGWFVYVPGNLSRQAKIAGETLNHEKIMTYELQDNYPNPFNPSTTIKYQLPQDGFVSLKVYDMLGREVANLVNELKKAGTYEVSFDAHNLASGVYVYTIRVHDFVQSKKMVLLK